MWGLIKKAGEFIAPMMAINSLEEFQESCTLVLSTITLNDSNDTISFNGALNNVQDYLSEEINSDDHPCLDYFVSESIMQQIVDKVDKDLPEEHIAPIFDFFSAFINTELNKHFLQVTVHRPFTKLLSLLDVFYSKSATETRQFVSNLWSTVRPSPIMLEMMSIDGKFPLLDFFFSLVFSPDKSNDYARDAIRSIVSKTSPELPSLFLEYIKKNLYPQIVAFLIQISRCVTTLQFNGAFTSLLLWIDETLTYYSDFPVDSLFQEIQQFSAAEQLLTISMLLSFFISPVIFERAMKYSLEDELFDIVKATLNSDVEFDRKAAVTFLKTLLRCKPEAANFMIPQAQTEAADVLSLLPPEWLVQIDGSTAMEAYETDAMTRINFYGIRRAQGTDKNIFGDILNILSNFKSQSMTLCLSLSELILMILANAPDLISTDLAKAYEAAVKQYSDVPYFQMPMREFADTKEVRAAILTEFGKEIHATFIASEKIKAHVEMFNHV
ncbi:hypothetical protein TRFO_08126 [Tritrichomonas foetus]|uniref:Uncharacterized protein n=1 Tax=Tritrichomonas foetus TaxID=1144522 RepID=A0A1J4JLY5_9EUKA|nr:hypothetical protein TRFO_08126 [Tritrichomonas foetus]|eukprot:OHT00129.1 hypothetical protein TRFO_08126 [Tritrichomonas foetus]